MSEGWPEWRKHVLEELKRQGTGQSEIKKELVDLRVSIANDIATLKVKSGIWGVIGGACITGAALLTLLLRGLL